jgi:uroporphyrinogen decarboxylase
MPHDVNDCLLLRAARGEQTTRTPIWLMRQAGRTDPEYMRLRAEAGLPLEALFRHPDWATRISLLPRRYGVDGIIFFQDILTPLAPMGAEFVFRPGPQLLRPINAPYELDRFEPYAISENLGFVGETLSRLRAELGAELPLLGFAGAPLTLAVFMLEGSSFGEAAPRTQQWLHLYPKEMHGLLERLTEMTIAYLRYQATSGAVLVQLFESAAFLFDSATYREFALPYQQKIMAALKGVVPTIIFARDWQDLDDLAQAGADVVSLPAEISVAEARSRLGQRRGIQGNLDNTLLATGTPELIEAAARKIVEEGAHHGHIFNLNHGLRRDTPLSNILHLVNTVRAL